MKEADLNKEAIKDLLKKVEVKKIKQKVLIEIGR